MAASSHDGARFAERPATYHFHDVRPIHHPGPDDDARHWLRELQLPRRSSISVVAVHDMLSDRIQAVPDPDAPLKESDTLIVAGTEKSLARAGKLK